MAGIGDTLLATPLISELRANLPGAQIDALVLWSGSKDILHGNPHLNAVYQKNLLQRSTIDSLPFLFSVRRNRYDVSINTHPQSRRHYRVIARIIGARTRISHVYESFGALDRLLVNRTLPQDYQRHSVDLNLDVLRLLELKPVLPNHQLELPISPAQTEWAQNFVREHKLEGRKILGLHAGSGGTKNLALKRWPLENYLELIRRLRQCHPETAILIFGGPDEETEIQKIIAADPGGLSFRARTESLRQAGVLMKLCTVFLSVDTALMHVAAAVRAPGQVVIEAFTLNKTNEPYGNDWTLVRNPAIAGRNLEYYRYDGAGIKGTKEELKRLMSAVSVESVLETLATKLGG
jgi:ADP-heptose:LPS heptosyltransferase